MEGGNDQQVQQFVKDSKSILKAHLNEYGLTLYSHKSTLRHNPVLFYGYNPGYDPKTVVDPAIRWTIEESLDYFRNGFKNLQESRDAPGRSLDLINDQPWPMPPRFVNYYEKGQAPYQQRVRRLLEAIDHRDALVTNLFFLQTRDAEQHRAIPDEEYKKACWKVHEIIFQITGPRVVITFHNTVKHGLRDAFRLGPVDERPTGWGSHKGKHWQGHWKSRKICVVSFPHFSRFDIPQASRTDVFKWVDDIVRKCADGWEAEDPAGT